MAESQQSFSYGAPIARDLEALISSKRYSTYLKKAGHKDDFAFELYLYNARLAKAFLFPLHVAEVVVRNAIDEILCAQYTNQWHMDAAFRSMITSESLKTLKKAIDRASKSGAPAQKDDVVSRLTFDFWSNLFRSEYDRPLWQTNIKTLMPNNPAITRASLKTLLVSINDFRNRIAHHEPIFALDVSLMYKEILQVVGYRSVTAENWIKCHSTVHKIMRSRPSSGLGAGPTLVSLCDGDFSVMSSTTKLSDVRAKQSQTKFIVCVDDKSGDTVGILRSAELGEFLFSCADESGLIDLTEHCLDDVCAHSSAAQSYAKVEGAEGVLALTSIFRGAVCYALVVDAGAPKGVISKAHRKY